HLMAAAPALSEISLRSVISAQHVICQGALLRSKIALSSVDDPGGRPYAAGKLSNSPRSGLEARPARADRHRRNGVRFPRAPGLDEFWQLLRDGRSGSTPANPPGQAMLLPL